MKRVFCLIALLAFLLTGPCAARAEGVSASGSLTFETPLDAGDASLDALLHLLDELRIGYAYAEKDGCFDLYTVVQLKDAPRTATDLVLYGTPAHWGLWVPKLGQTRLMLNNEAMVEFGLKMWNHLSLPLHRLALLYPWVHQAALTRPKAAWDLIFHASEGTRTIPREALISLAEELAELAENDAAFSTYLSALGEATGLGERLSYLFWEIPAWLEEYAPDGIDIVSTATDITWYAGVETLFSSAADGSNWKLYLPAFLDGDTVFCRFDPTDSGFVLEVYPDGEEGAPDSWDLYLALRNSAPDTGRFQITIGGAALSERMLPVLSDHLISLSPIGDQLLTYYITSENAQWTLSDQNQTKLLIVHNHSVPYTPDRWPAYLDIEIQGVNFFSLNDSSLEELMHTLLIPAVKAAVPLIAAAPAESVAALMNWVEQIGLLGE